MPPMQWNSNLTNLRDVLAALYLTVQESLSVVEAAGMNPAFVDFDSRAITNWHNILREANKRNKVQAIIEVAQKQYPENEFLKLAQDNALTTVRGPDIASKVTWHNGDGNILEKIMGTQSTLLPISFLETGLQCAKAVVRVIRGDGEKGSGFLTENNLLITNHHVLANATEAAQATIQFNYQQSARGLDLEAVPFKLNPDEVFKTSDTDDWTVVRVQGNPNQAWGALKLVRVNPKKDDWVNIIQHPGGGYKHIALYHNMITYADNRLLQYLTDTQPGSSGSPVFDSQWRVVALHHSGGWLREPNTKQMIFRNEGIHINVVIDVLSATGLYNER